MDIIGKLMKDDDLMKVAAVAFILWRDHADYKLILVLFYVFFHEIALAFSAVLVYNTSM